MVTKKIGKRGRPREFDVDEAIATAMELFHQRGYDGVGVAELSKAIGITAPSLYSAFGSKRELFEQVLERYVQQNGCWLPAALSEGETLELSISNLFIQAAENYAADPEKPGCLVMDGTRNCTDGEAITAATCFRQATQGLISDRIIKGAPNLSLSEANSLTNYAVMILVGLSGSARDGMRAKALRTTAEIAAEGFVQQLSQYLSTE